MPTYRIAPSLLSADFARLGRISFWCVGQVPGLPCGLCGEATQDAVAEIFACVQCDHQHVRELTHERAADPAHCDFCNP